MKFGISLTTQIVLADLRQIMRLQLAMLISLLLFTIVAAAPFIKTVMASEPLEPPEAPTLESPTPMASSLPISDLMQLTQTFVLLVTLFVLIHQVRDTRRVSRMAHYLDAIQMMSNIRSEILGNAKLINPDQESSFFRDMYSLVGKEGYYYKLKLFHAFELFFLLHKYRLIEDDMWLGWHNNMRLCFDADVNRRVWIAIRDKDLFHPKFKTLVDGLTSPGADGDHRQNAAPKSQIAAVIADSHRRVPRFVAGDTALAAINDEDWPYFHRWLNSADMVKSMRDLDPFPISEEDARRYIASHRKDAWLILACEGTQWIPIGYVSIMVRHKHKIGRLFIAIGESEYLARGHGKRACDIIVSWSFNECNLEAIHLSVSANNSRAMALYSKQGFRECGRYIKARFENGQRYDEVLMELTQEMWARRNMEAQA